MDVKTSTKDLGGGAASVTHHERGSNKFLGWDLGTTSLYEGTQIL
jgi:hypothetical protein